MKAKKRYCQFIARMFVPVICMALLSGCGETVELPDAEQGAGRLAESSVPAGTKETSAETMAENTVSTDIRLSAPAVGEYTYPAQVAEDSSEKADALALTQEILGSPGKVFLLGSGYANPLEVLLDADLDGTPDRISFICRGEAEDTWRYEEIGEASYVSWEMYELSVGGETAELGYPGSTENRFMWNILAVSPDGERIAFGIREYCTETVKGETRLYTYDGTSLTCIYSDFADILDGDTVISKENITANRYTSAPIANRVRFNWVIDSEGKYQPAYEEMYDYLDKGSILLNAAMVLYSEPDAASPEAAEIEPQQVTLLKTDLGIEKGRDPSSAVLLGGAQSWIYLRAENGDEGWVQIGDMIETAAGELMMWYEAYDLLETEIIVD